MTLSLLPQQQQLIRMFDVFFTILFPHRAQVTSAPVNSTCEADEENERLLSQRVIFTHLQIVLEVSVAEVPHRSHYVKIFPSCISPLRSITAIDQACIPLKSPLGHHKMIIDIPSSFNPAVR